MSDDNHNALSEPLLDEGAFQTALDPKEHGYTLA